MLSDFVPNLVAEPNKIQLIVERFKNPNLDFYQHGYLVCNHWSFNNYWCCLIAVLSGRAQKKAKK